MIAYNEARMLILDHAVHLIKACTFVRRLEKLGFGTSDPEHSPT
jgi:hypothetical protein